MRNFSLIKYLFPSMLVFFLTSLHQPLFADSVPKKNSKSLIMGVFPIVSSGALFKRFAPLKDYLAKKTGRDIILETAKDFPTFVHRTAKRQYDIVITAPHFSLLASDSKDYKIIVRPKRDLQSLLVVPENSNIDNVSQLSGKLIATPPTPALTTRSGKKYLIKKGLTGKNSARYTAFKTHNAAYQATLGKDADAAIVSNNVLHRALKSGIPLRVIEKLPPLPAMATLIATNIDKRFATDIEKIMVDMEKTKQGIAVLKQIRFPGYISAREIDYLAVRPYKPTSSKIGKK